MIIAVKNYKNSAYDYELIRNKICYRVNNELNEKKTFGYITDF